MKTTKQYKLHELFTGLEVDIKGDPNCLITGISPIHQAETGDITFLTNPIYRKCLADTEASAVILTADAQSFCPVIAVVSSNPHYIYAKVSYLFAENEGIVTGIHPSVVLGDEVNIDETASIGPNCVLGNRVHIAAYVRIAAGSFIGSDTKIDEKTIIGPHVTVYHKVTIGKRVNIASGTVIGSDGFGFASYEGVWHKVSQLGSVVICDDVDIGANTTIDRGAIGDTVIEEGVKLDNLIQIGHNVRIGAHTIIAGCVAIAGSTQLGKRCMIGGGTRFAGHIVICDDTAITGMTAVTKSITEPGIYSSGVVGAVPNHEFRKNNARFHRLENLFQRIKVLENNLKEGSKT